MKFSHAVLTLVLLVMVSFLVCMVAGDNGPVKMITVTANSSVITAYENDTYLITLHEVNANATMSDENQTIRIIPLQAAIPNETNSAAIVLSGIDGNESTFMGRVSYAKNSADLKSLSLNLTPLKYYDGMILQRFFDNKIEVNPGNYSTTSIHIESMIPIQNNRIYCRVEWYTGRCEFCCYEPYDTTMDMWLGCDPCS